MNKNQGFTLIELLVVVLIIGILSSVALPQYTRAVEKSRVSAVFPLLKAVVQAKKSYYLANSTHARSFADLDIALPSICTPRADAHYGETASCGKYSFNLDDSSHGSSFSYHLGDGSYIWVQQAVEDSSMSCGANPAADNNASKLCLSLGAKADTRRTANGMYWYDL